MLVADDIGYCSRKGNGDWCRCDLSIAKCPGECYRCRTIVRGTDRKSRNRADAVNNLGANIIDQALRQGIRNRQIADRAQRRIQRQSIGNRLANGGCCGTIIALVKCNGIYCETGIIVIQGIIVWVGCSVIIFALHRGTAILGAPVSIDDIYMAAIDVDIGAS